MDTDSPEPPSPVGSHKSYNGADQSTSGSDQSTSGSHEVAPGSALALRGAGVLRISPPLAFAIVGAVVAAYVLQRGFVLAHRTLGWVVACSVVALLVEPLVQWLSRRLPRVVAIFLSVLAIVSVTVGALARLSSELTASVKALNQSAPLAAARLEERSSIARDLRVADTIRAFTGQLTRDLNQETLARVKTAPSYLVTGILMLFLLVHGRRYVNGGLAQIADPLRRARARNVVRTGLRRGRNRLLVGLIQIVLVTMVAFGLFEFLRLRASFILAVLLGVASLMPVVGLPVAGLPAAVMAYGLRGTSSAVAVGLFVVAVQAVDLLWWRRRCDRLTVETGLFVPLVATLVGYRLYRVGGAVYGYALVVLALAMIAAADIDRDDNDATWAGTDIAPVVPD